MPRLSDGGGGPIFLKGTSVHMYRLHMYINTYSVQATHPTLPVMQLNEAAMWDPWFSSNQSTIAPPLGVLGPFARSRVDTRISPRG